MVPRVSNSDADIQSQEFFWRCVDIHVSCNNTLCRSLINSIPNLSLVLIDALGVRILVTFKSSVC